jgi:hypothetical protein
MDLGEAAALICVIVVATVSITVGLERIVKVLRQIEANTRSGKGASDG